MENVAGTREGQFGAIGTRRDQWQVTGVTQPPLLLSSSPRGPDTTATAGSNTTSTG